MVGHPVPTEPTANDLDDLAAQFLGLACLTYGDVGPEQWAEAHQLLAEHPEIVEDNVFAAAVAANVDALERMLRSNPALAVEAGGPNGWEPLLYLAFARHDATLAEDQVLAAARLLLDAGADPNAGFLWDDLPIPFTALTGAFGEGEMGPTLQPRHPHSLSLARLLLEAGAEPNDGQALYNRMFGVDNDHLELLFEFGLGTGEGGPWRQRAGDALESPAQLLRGQLAWAIPHGMADRVLLLADHGVDLVAPFDETSALIVATWAGADGDAPTPVVVAALTGHPELVELMVDQGVPRPTLTPGGAFTSAALSADRAEVDRLRGERSYVVDDVRASRPALVVWAASIGRVDAVALLVELGFGVNTLGRTDLPSNQPWQTALHKATEDDDVELGRVLLGLGADPNKKDRRFEATPLGWAQNFDRPQFVELLEPLTAPDESAG
jgi:ankyrin repeat protein